jgi:hypothetical protein
MWNTKRFLPEPALSTIEGVEMTSAACHFEEATRLRNLVRRV